jgi:hypothetical protein
MHDYEQRFRETMIGFYQVPHCNTPVHEGYDARIITVMERCPHRLPVPDREERQTCPDRSDSTGISKKRACGTRLLPGHPTPAQGGADHLLMQRRPICSPYFVNTAHAGQ